MKKNNTIKHKSNEQDYSIQLIANLTFVWL